MTRKLSLTLCLLRFICSSVQSIFFNFFFFNDTATTEIYTLSLHDALPISEDLRERIKSLTEGRGVDVIYDPVGGDRKSTRLNSSHLVISYAVFCLKKKNNT